MCYNYCGYQTFCSSVFGIKISHKTKNLSFLNDSTSIPVDVIFMKKKEVLTAWFTG